MRLPGKVLLCAVGGSFIFASNTYGQVVDPTSNMTTAVEQASREELAQKEAMAEAIVAREEAQSGRSFDPAFRARAKEALASLSLSALEAQQSQIGLGTNALGDTGADLVYTPITPCRIIDTRSGGGAIAANTTRNFVVTGTTGFPAQGGTTGGCGVPVGATSAMINFVAVNGVAPGDLRVTPFGTAMPLASILNWALGNTGLNLANGLAIKLCDPAVTTCTSDITLQADASAIDIVADVQGYFERVPRSQQNAFSSSLALVNSAASPSFLLGQSNVAVGVGESILVSAGFGVWANNTTQGAPCGGGCTTIRGQISACYRPAGGGTPTRGNHTFIWHTAQNYPGGGVTARMGGMFVQHVFTFSSGGNFDFGICGIRDTTAATDADWNIYYPNVILSRP